MKHLILKTLYNNLNTYVSGKEIAKTLGISRVAVKKHIDGMIKLGYDISAVKKNGYMLKSFCDNYDEYAVKMFLSLYGTDENVCCYKSTDSTNIQAKKHLYDGQEGVVFALSQTSGKGRKGRSFSSGEGGVYLSYFCKPFNLTPFDAVKTVIATAVAVYDTFSDLGISCGIKWANDIIIGNKKACGILCEMISENENVNALIQGIGINVNNTLSDELGDIAVSLQQIKGKKLCRAEICALLIKNLKICNDILFSGGFKGLLERYREHCLTIGKEVTVYGETKYDAVAVNVDENGFLTVNTKNGIKTVVFGDVSVKTKHLS